MLAGKIAAARGDFDRAIAHLERTVRLEDSLVYTEPSEFHFPPRHALGAVLLEAGRPSEAETVTGRTFAGTRIMGELSSVFCRRFAHKAKQRMPHSWKRVSRKRGRGQTSN